MNQILTFNLAAAGIIGDLSRLRLNKKTRGGVDYAALRPSHRVKGTNPMLKVEKIEGTETLQAELTPELSALVEGIPALKNQTTYLMHDIGYGWWTLKNFEGDVATSEEPLVTVTRATKSKAKTVPVTDAAPATPTEAAEEATADAALDVLPTTADEPTATAATTDAIAALADTPAPTVAVTASEVAEQAADTTTPAPAEAESTAALPSANDDDADENITPDAGAAANSAVRAEAEDGIVTHVLVG